MSCERTETSKEQEKGNIPIEWEHKNGVIEETKNNNTRVRTSFPRTERLLNAFLNNFQEQRGY